MKIIAVYDNEGATLDRYTVYYDVEEKPGFNACLGMNAAPFHPQGIGMHGSGQLGDHNGKRIYFEELPEDCQIAAARDLA